METKEKFKSTDDFRVIRDNSFWRISGITKRCYDRDQACLFGSSMKRSTVYYEYIPADFMEEGVPFIIGSGITYDGGKEQDKAVKDGAMVLSFKELPSVFKLNKFSC